MEADRTLEAKLLADFGESRKSLEATKQQATAAQSHLNQIFREHGMRLLPLKADHQRCAEASMKLQNQRNYLLQQLKATDQEIMLQREHMILIESNINEVQAAHDAHVASLSSTHGKLITALRKDELLKELLTQMHRLEQTVGTCVPSLPPSASTTPSTSVSLPFAFQAYVIAECDCISFLAKRLQLLNNKIASMLKQTAEYKNLGIQASIRIL